MYCVLASYPGFSGRASILNFPLDGDGSESTTTGSLSESVLYIRSINEESESLSISSWLELDSRIHVAASKAPGTDTDTARIRKGAEMARYHVLLRFHLYLMCMLV